MTSRTHTVKFLRAALMIGISVFFIGAVFRLAGAGSLTPPSAPAGTMHSVEEVYAPLVGTYDSSAVVASKQGNALQISKCIISKVTGGPACP